MAPPGQASMLLRLLERSRLRANHRRLLLPASSSSLLLLHARELSAASILTRRPPSNRRPLRFESQQSQQHQQRRRWLSSSSSTATSDEDEGFCMQRGAEALLEAFTRYGHYEAQLDPLGLAPIRPRPELDPANYFPPSSLHRPLPPSAVAGIDLGEGVTPLELAARLRAVYCRSVGFEVAHIDDASERAWLTKRIGQLFGGNGGLALSPAERVNAATLMLQAEAFEHFLGRKFPSFKRYSGEGAEAMQPAVDAILRSAHAFGAGAVVIGMPHRGRLALLASQLEYPIRRLLHKVAGKGEFPADMEGLVDDVTSHLAASLPKHYTTHQAPPPAAIQDETSSTPSDPPPLRVSLLHNPSHLEIIGCVAAGKTRAKRSDGVDNALCLQIHGDAAMSGQGCIQETFSLARLKGFDIDGTVHLVVNNQLGFTTAQGEGGGEGRSSRYCTDVAKMLQVPILHVNAEAVDDVMLVCKLAVAYRHAFGKDVIVDLHTYRLHGHNEVDEPAFTNPLTYARVRDPQRQTPASSYIQRLVGQGLMTRTRAESLRQRFDAHLEQEYQASLSYDITAEGQGPDAFEGKWNRMRHPKGEELHAPVATGVPLDVLRHIGTSSVALPTPTDKPFALHPRLAKSFVASRLAALEKGVVDWATAEALAIGSLLAQGFDVRLCGQDSGRGTFSQRHFLLTDQATGATYCPLAHVIGSTGRLEVVNSNLSELAVLGFEYGHSIEGPMRLGIWEAQFGDFHNGAQMVIDTFLGGGESKWLRQSGLVLLLPHGHDGAGPEHSSARLERFLQLSNDVSLPPGPLHNSTGFVNPNLLVQHPTTPANYFHSLRRQLLRPCRKPLVIAAPKTLLRHPLAVSPLETMGVGATFQPILASTLDGVAWSPSPARKDSRGRNGDKNGGGGGKEGKDKGRNGNGKKGMKEGAGGSIKAMVFCSGKVYYDAIKSPRAGVDPSSVLLVRLEELAPFPRPALERLLDSVFLPTNNNIGDVTAPLKAVLWLQEEPLNAGAWSFVQPHLTRLLQDRTGGASLRTLEYIGRPPLPTPAVGLSEAHKRQSAELMEALWARLAAAVA